MSGMKYWKLDKLPPVPVDPAKDQALKNSVQKDPVLKDPPKSKETDKEGEI